MKRAHSIVAAATLAILAGSAALAEGGAVRAQDPTSITAALFDAGIPSKISTDNYDDPLVQFRTNDRQFFILFYNCTDHADCTNIQFYARYDTNGDVGLDVVNAMNNDNRFAYAVIDDEDDVVILMDVLPGENGLSAADFNTLVDTFVEVVADFEDRVGWVPE
ncbi:MAG: YbjN domain-containing protein [Alphaproteobacteria bacterium]|nr:MAG: YbjN domain-containing protein [Alphaproteobacteria bacterium]